MGLTTALIAATSGLKAAQAGIDLVSRNIANSTTEGYTRKLLPQTPQVVGGEGQGVSIGVATRQVNYRLQIEVRTGLSTSESYRVQDDLLSRLELSFGKPGDNTSIASQLAQLGDAFRTLSTSPDVLTAQTTVVSRAESLARGLNDLTDAIQGLRTESEQAIGTSVDTINSKLTAINDLNVQIAQAKVGGQSTADLEDRRDTFLDELSKEIDITYFTRSDGQIWIMTKSGRALLDTVVHTVSFSDAPNLNAQLSYPLSLNGIVVDGRDITPDLQGGRLKGYFELRDTVLPQAQLQIDEFASKLTTLFAAQDLELFQDGATTFNTANTTGYAGRIAVNAAVKSDPWRTRDGTVVATQSTNTGDTTIPLNIIDMFESLQTFPGATGLGTSFTLEGYAAAFITFQGTQRANKGDMLKNEMVLTEALQTRLTNDSGVNVDRELALMVELQNAYAANARIIQAVKEMMDELMRAV